MKQASKQSNNNAVAAATSLSPAQCKSQSFLRALFAARVCAVLTLLPISVNWAIGCLKWIAAAAFLLLLLLLLIPPESSFRHVALDSQYHVQQCGSNSVANDNIPRVASGPNYQSPIPSDLWGSWKPTLGGCLPACRAGLMLFWVLDSIIVPNYGISH